MTNTNYSEALARIKPKTVPGVYEVSTLDDGTIIVKPRVNREKPLVDERKPKNG